MASSRSKKLLRIVMIFAALLSLKVTASIVYNYRNYIPPNFDSEFLNGRRGYFFGPYQWAFYTHIATGPIALILGLILISDQYRRKFPRWHRYLGRIQAVVVLLFMTPSGIWMAWYAASGPVGAVGLAVLGILTAACFLLGWRAAVRRRFPEHRRWMWRTYLLLNSAVVLRLMAGFALTFSISLEWYDPLANWLAWILPLSVFEAMEFFRRRSR